MCPYCSEPISKNLKACRDHWDKKFCIFKNCLDDRIGSSHFCRVHRAQYHNTENTITDIDKWINSLPQK